MDMTTKLLDVQNVSISFDGLKALDSVSLSVEKGKIFSLIGPNGAGKTTLFNIIAGSLYCRSGKLTFKGEEITGKKPFEICRNGIARTFQLKNAFPQLTVFKNVEAGMLREVDDKSERQEKVFEILEFLGIGDIAKGIALNLTPLESKFMELGRALATNPKLILLDELIGGLLAVETDKICHIVELLKARGISILQIGHEMKPIMKTSDHIFVLDQGRNIADGKPDEIRRNEEVLACYLE
jgi:branched-chain amino acid transport system ATP-binding protein